MKRIHHILAMVLLTAFFAFSLVGYCKGVEDDTEASVTQGGNAESGPVDALKNFFQAVADKDGEKAASFWIFSEAEMEGKEYLVECINSGLWSCELQEVVSEKTEGDSSFVFVKILEIEDTCIFSMLKVDGEWKILSSVSETSGDDEEEMDVLPVDETSAPVATSPPAAESEVVAALKNFFQAVADKDGEKIASFFVSNAGVAEFVADIKGKNSLELLEFVSEQTDGDSSLVIAKVNMENDEITSFFLLKSDGRWRIQDMQIGRGERKNDSAPVGESEAVVALKDFLQAVSDKDGEKVADFLSPQSAALSELREWLKGVNNGMISWKLLGIVSEQTEGDRSTIVTKIHYKFKNVPCPFFMSKINGEWKISLGP